MNEVVSLLDTEKEVEWRQRLFQHIGVEFMQRGLTPSCSLHSTVEVEHISLVRFYNSARILNSTHDLLVKLDEGL